MSATPFADHRTTAGDTFSGQSRIIYILCLLNPIVYPPYTRLYKRYPLLQIES